MRLATTNRRERRTTGNVGARRLSLAAGALGTALSLVAGCSGDTNNNSGPALADVPGLYADALCQSVQSCLGSLTPLFLNGADCKTVLEKQVEDDGFSVVPSSVSAGKIVYRANKVDACIAKIKALTCDAFMDRAPDECTQALEGQVAIGQQCSIDNECAPGSFCDAQNQCPGLCKARLLAGDKCSRDDDCQSGLVCSNATGLCVTPAGEGASCDGGAAPPCAFGLLCLGSTATSPGACRNVSKLFTESTGAKCDPTNTTSPVLCTSNVSCAAVALSAGGLTWQCVSPVASGASCHPAFLGMCPAGQYCKTPALSVDGTCTDLPAAGSPCVTATLPGPICAPGLVCDNGTCRERQSLGGPCNTNATCYSGTCRNGGCVRSDSCN